MTLIRVVDFEATAFAEDGGRICAVGYADLIGEGDRWVVPGMTGARATLGRSRLCNPGIHIPSTASAVHHIIDSDVEDAEPFDVREIMWVERLPLIANCDDPDLPTFHQHLGARDLVTIFAAHNAQAERGYLANHLALDVLGDARWLCSYKCSMRHWPEASGHSVGALRYELGLDVPREWRGHDAAEDVLTTALLVERLLRDVPLETLLEWSTQPVLQAICRIGDWRGTRWEDVDSGFMRWCLGKDMDEDLLHTCRYWLQRREDEARAAVADQAVDDTVSQVLLEHRGQQRLL